MWIAFFALRVLRVWIVALDQASLYSVLIRAGDALVKHQMEVWMRTERCIPFSAVSSEIVSDIQKMPEWLLIDTSPHPVFLPERLRATELLL